MHAPAPTRFVVALALVVLPAACRQLVGIDDSRPVLGDDASSASDALSAGDASSSGDARDAVAESAADAAARLESGADGAGNGDAQPDGEGGVTCPTTGAADRRFPQWRLPPVHPDASSYLVGTDTVLDTVTGLVWERNPSGLTMDQESAVARCGSLKAGQFTDWRMPTRIELASIVDYGSTSHLSPTALGTVPESGQVWSSSALNATNVNPAGPITLDLDLMSTPVLPTTSGGLAYSMCVRAGCVSGAPARFVIASDGVAVLDAATGLTWQRGVSATKTSLVDAGVTCGAFSAGGLTSGWRVPTIRELASIFDETRGAPPLWDPTIFSTNGPTEVWSSTPVGGGDPDVYTLDFSDTTNNFILHASPCTDSACTGDVPFPVRCVHDP